MYTKTCPVCGKEFSFRFLSQYPTRKYCSKSCRSKDKGHDRRITIICAICGKHFVVPPYAKFRKFCSQTCMGKSKSRPLRERLLEKIDDSGGPDACWPFIGATHGRNKCRYGSIEVKPGRTELPHRVMWELMNGPIPTGMNCLHRCDNGLCCNPKHLFLGSIADNVHDMIAKGRDVKPPQPTSEQRARGSRNGMTKLTESDVIEIRHLASEGIAVKAIAKKFGVIPSNIHHIIRRLTWKHI